MRCDHISCRLSLFFLALLVSFEARAAPFCFAAPQMEIYRQLALGADFDISVFAGQAAHSLRLLHLRLPVNDVEKVRARQAVSTSLSRKDITVFGHIHPLDRYQRVLGHLVDQQIWLQEEWVSRGFFRVLPGMVAADGLIGEGELACLGTLFRAEMRAVQERRGLWADDENTVLAADDLAALQKHVAEFVLVEGVVRAVGKGRDRHFINFGDDWRSDFTVVVPQPVLTHWPKDLQHTGFLQGRSLSSLVGRKVRIRGWLTSYHGPEVLLDDLSQVEILERADMTVGD